MKVGLGFPTEIQTYPINNTMNTSTYLITEREKKNTYYKNDGKHTAERCQHKRRIKPTR